MEILNSVLLVIVLGALAYIIFKNRAPRLKASLASVVMCDSSALIDGRVIEVAKAGFLSGTVVVPSSVLREMQYLADNSDHEKRARARHGLDVVHQLQEMPDVTVQILDDGELGGGGVDDRLIELCKQHQARLLTLDFNLNKVAAAEGVMTLNINQLAQSLRMSYLPGEKRSLLLTQKGQDAAQAVGYLEDGTMVVVEKAGKDVGSNVEVEFTRVLQTTAGKMLFAKKTAVANTPNASRIRQPAGQRPPKNNKPSSPPVRRDRRRSPEDSLVELANK